MLKTGPIETVVISSDPPFKKKKAGMPDRQQLPLTPFSDQ